MVMPEVILTNGYKSSLPLGTADGLAGVMPQFRGVALADPPNASDHDRHAWSFISTNISFTSASRSFLSRSPRYSLST
jgi:hypothetical protein